MSQGVPSADPAVEAIVIDTDSPGGTGSGIPELGAEVAAGARVKPGVALGPAVAAVEKLADAGGAAFSGKATTSVKFSEPGEYVLHVVANDYSGEGGSGEVCCWTTALVKVTVTK